MNKAIIFSLEFDMPYRSLGAHRIATIMRNSSWNVEVIDWANYFSSDELKYIANSRIDSNTKIIGFSCNFGLFTIEIDQYITWIKKTYPHVKVIIGGQYLPDMISKDADYYITGFGENAIIAVMKYLESNGPSVKFKIIHNKKVIDGNIFYPSFPMKNLDVKYEKRDYLLPEEWVGVEMARGCKFECPYCNFPILGVKGDYTRDVDNYYFQLKRNYDDWGLTKYLVADETFNDTTEKIIKFADITESLDFTPYLSGFIRADLLVIRQQDKEHLARMGFYGQFYGVETMNSETSKVIGKGIKTERLQEGLLDINNYYSVRKLPYRGTLSLVIGLPKETVQSQENTFTWIKNNWLKNYQSVKSFPLEIPSPDSTFLKPSKMSNDLEKYGYKINVEEEYNDNYNAMQHGHVINWKNDEFTNSTAKQIVDNFNDSIEEKNPLNNFTFSYFLDHPVDLIKNNFTENFKDEITQIEKRNNNINRYKALKLNQ
jgi:radical SAM superfamily enzyme YgiQ (UPF0313 family)